jgi:hypothetical protein
MVAVAIFTIGFLIFYFYAFNNPNESKEIIESLEYDGKIISNMILSEGNPSDWTSSNVFKIGILTGNIINQSKLDEFYYLTQIDYEHTKLMFNTKYDYLFFLESNMTVNSTNVDHIGMHSVDKNNIDTKNLIKITRFTSYDGKPTSAYLYIWGDY